MNREFFVLFFVFFLSFSLQVLVFNNILILQNYNPYIYILFILIYPPKINKYLFLGLSFLLGYSIDLFMYTGGIHAFASVFLAFTRVLIIKTIVGNNYYDEEFSMNNFNFFQKLIFIILSVLTHHFVLFSIENFNFRNYDNVLLNTLFSSGLTISLLLIYFGFFERKQIDE